VNIRCPAQTLIPRRVIDETGPFSDFSAQDYDYYLRVSSRFPVTFHAHSLVRWRDREESMSGRRSRRELTWSRQKLLVLRAYSRRYEPPYRADVERQIVWNRAEAAFHLGEVADLRRARRALRMLVLRRPWPPTALPFLIASAAPGLARAVHRIWTRRTL